MDMKRFLLTGIQQNYTCVFILFQEAELKGKKLIIDIDVSE